VLFELGVGRRTSDRTEQDRKKVKRVIFHPFGELTEAIYIINCAVGELLDEITCAKSQNEI